MRNSQEKIIGNPRESALLRGGRLRKTSRGVVSFAPFFMGVSTIALGAMLAFSGNALAGTCAETSTGSGTWECTGAAGTPDSAQSIQTQAITGAVTVTTASGFGLAVNDGQGLLIEAVGDATSLDVDLGGDITSTETVPATADDGRGENAILVRLNLASVTATPTLDFSTNATATGTDAGDDAIDIFMNAGSQGVTVTSSGVLKSATGHGIRFEANATATAATGAVSITATGDIGATGSGNAVGGSGIHADSRVHGDLTVAASKIFAAQRGIYANNRASTSGGSFTGNTSVTANGAVASGGVGIRANHEGTGTLTVTTMTGGTITTTDGHGIHATTTSVATGMTITTAAAITAGGTGKGIYAQHGGSGMLTITSGGTISTNNGHGIHATTVAAATGMSITTTAAITARGTGTGILADHQGSGDLSITSGGMITTTDGNGISAATTSAATDMTITTTAGITAGGSGLGIAASHSGSGTLTITSGGVIITTTGHGIHASTAATTTGMTITTTAGITAQGSGKGILAEHGGTGATSITTSSIINSRGNGIEAKTTNTAATTLTIQVNNDINSSVVKGTGGSDPETAAVYASHTGTGALSITTGSSATLRSTGAGSHGIFAKTAHNTGSDAAATTAADNGAMTITANGAIGSTGNSVGGNGIHAEHGNVGALTITTNAILATGKGIYATNSANGGDISITANGAVTSGGDGIDARQLGTGALTITTASGGTISTTTGHGIRASTAATATGLDITTAATIAAGGSGKGILADHGGSGALSITTNAAIFAGDNGIEAKSTNTAATTLTIEVNDNVTTTVVKGTNTGDPETAAIYASHTGSGALSITTDSSAVLRADGAGTHGIFAKTARNNSATAGAATITANGDIGATGNAVGGDGIRLEHANRRGNLSITAHKIFATGSGINAKHTGESGHVRVFAEDVIQAGETGVLVDSNALGLLLFELRNDGSTTNGEISVTGSDAKDGVRLMSSNTASTTLTATIQGSVSTTGAQSTADQTANIERAAVYASHAGRGRVTVTTGGKIIANGAGTHGVFAKSAHNSGSNAASTNANDQGGMVITVNNDLGSSLSSIGGDGIHAEHGNVGDLTINANFVGANNNFIQANGKAIYATNSANGGDIAITSGVQMSGRNGGIDARQLGTGMLAITLNNDGTSTFGTISTTTGHAIQASSAATSTAMIITTTQAARGVQAMITAGGGGNHGIHAAHAGTGTLQIASGGDIAATGTGSHGIFATTALNTGSDAGSGDAMTQGGMTILANGNIGASGSAIGGNGIRAEHGNVGTLAIIVGHSINPSDGAITQSADVDIHATGSAIHATSEDVSTTATRTALDDNGNVIMENGQPVTADFTTYNERMQILVNGDISSTVAKSTDDVGAIYAYHQGTDFLLISTDGSLTASGTGAHGILAKTALSSFDAGNGGMFIETLGNIGASGNAVGADGIHAEHANTGALSITLGEVTFTPIVPVDPVNDPDGPTMGGEPVFGTNTGEIHATEDGIDASASESGTLSVIIHGTIAAGDTGIRATQSGGGAIAVLVNRFSGGNAINAANSGILAEGSNTNAGDISLTSLGQITAGTNAIHAIQRGGGDVSIMLLNDGTASDGAITAGTNGIRAESIASTNTVTRNVLDENGMVVMENGQPVTETVDVLTSASAMTIVTQGAVSTTGTKASDGDPEVAAIHATHEGTGTLSITTTDKLTAAGQGAHGIFATTASNANANTENGMVIRAQGDIGTTGGTGNLIGRDGIHAEHGNVGMLYITLGEVTSTPVDPVGDPDGPRRRNFVSTADIHASNTGIHAETSANASHAVIIVNGEINAGGTGIHADHKGSGMLEIETKDQITAVLGYGIYAKTASHTSQSSAGLVIKADGDIGDNGRFVGESGIFAEHNNAGDVSITAAKIFASGEGIRATSTSASSDMTIQVNAVDAGAEQSSADTTAGIERAGIYADHQGDGALTIQITGSGSSVDSDYGHGIFAKTSATTSEMVIDTYAGPVSGNVRSGAGVNGIYANHQGSGNLRITTRDVKAAGEAIHAMANNAAANISVAVGGTIADGIEGSTGIVMEHQASNPSGFLHLFLNDQAKITATDSSNGDAVRMSGGASQLVSLQPGAAISGDVVANHGGSDLPATLSLIDSTLPGSSADVNFNLADLNQFPGFNILRTSGSRTASGAAPDGRVFRALILNGGDFTTNAPFQLSTPAANTANIQIGTNANLRLQGANAAISGNAINNGVLTLESGASFSGNIDGIHPDNTAAQRGDINISGGSMFTGDATSIDRVTIAGSGSRFTGNILGASGVSITGEARFEGRIITTNGGDLVFSNADVPLFLTGQSRIAGDLDKGSASSIGDIDLNAGATLAIDGEFETGGNIAITFNFNNLPRNANGDALVRLAMDELTGTQASRVTIRPLGVPAIGSSVNGIVDVTGATAPPLGEDSFVFEALPQEGIHEYHVVYDAATTSWNLLTLRTVSGIPVLEAYPATLSHLARLPAMRQRLGNRIWANEEGRGVWAEVEGATAEVEPTNSHSDSDSIYEIQDQRLRFGVTLPVASDLNLGADVSFGQAGAEVTAIANQKSEIDTEVLTIGMSSTWRYGALYTDGQFQYATFESDLTSDGSRNTSGHSANAFSASGEIGWRFEFDGFDLTPQAQVDWVGVEFDDFAVGALEVALEDGETVNGRVGISIDRDWRESAGRRGYLYGSIDMVAPLDGETASDISGQRQANEMEKVAVDLGLGVSYEWNKGGSAITGDFSTTQGDEMEAYRGSLGLRFGF